MMKPMIALTLVTLLAAGTLPALAEDCPHHPKKPHKERVEQGLKSGSLTAQEAKRLAARKKALQEKQKAYQADGKLTPEERAELQAERKRLSHQIYHQKHDAQTRK